MFGMRRFLPLVLLIGLAACSGKEVWAPDDQVASAAYIHNGPPSITLVTVINNETGGSGHSALVINSRQRVVFDPAGNFKHSKAPERNDFVYGMFPEMLRAYYGFHARKEWHVVTQEVVVTPEVAEQAFQLTKNFGAVPSGFCANAVSEVLGQLPGFKNVGHSLYPKRLMRDFAGQPGVKTEKIFEDD
jgi:hypothetical protein